MLGTTQNSPGPASHSLPRTSKRQPCSCTTLAPEPGGEGRRSNLTMQHLLYEFNSDPAYRDTTVGGYLQFSVPLGSRGPTTEPDAMLRSLVLSAFAGLVYATAGRRPLSRRRICSGRDTSCTRRVISARLANCTQSWWRTRPPSRSCAVSRSCGSRKVIGAPRTWRLRKLSTPRWWPRPTAPLHHRAEAEAAIQELQRLRAGQPARDPAASRIQPPKRPEPGVTLVVSPAGADTHPGTAAQPFATLARAGTKSGRSRIAEVCRPAVYASSFTGGATPFPLRSRWRIRIPARSRLPSCTRLRKGKTPFFPVAFH